MYLAPLFLILLVSVFAREHEVRFRLHMYFDGKHDKIVKCVAEYPVYRCDADDTVRAMVNRKRAEITSCYSLSQSGSVSIGNSDYSITVGKNNENHYFKCFVTADNVTDVVCIATIQVSDLANDFKITDYAITAQLHPSRSNKVYNLTYTDYSLLHIVCDCSDNWKKDSHADLCRLHKITNEKKKPVSTNQRNINKNLWLYKSCDKTMFQCATGNTTAPLEVGVRLKYVDKDKKTQEGELSFVLIGSITSACCIIAAAAGCVCWNLRKRPLLQKCCCNQRGSLEELEAKIRLEGRKLSEASSTSTHIYEEPVYNSVYEERMWRNTVGATTVARAKSPSPPPAELRRPPASRPHYTDSELLRMDDDGYTLADPK